NTRIRSCYLFPLSSPRRRLGILVVSTVQEGEFSAEDVSLLDSVASHVGASLETALSVDEAERYQSKLVCERDRFQLLLDINNHVSSHLNVDDLLHAACISIRKYFANDFAGFWIIDKSQRHLECAVLDFPNSKGQLEELSSPALSDEDLQRIRARQTELLSAED